MKYYATWSVAEAYFPIPYVSHNKKQLLKDICEICRGEWSKGECGRFTIEDECRRVVYLANILPNGVIQYVTKNYVDKF